ncbi:unnamed protein product, partial [Prorocentrum cordatum]
LHQHRLGQPAKPARGPVRGRWLRRPAAEDLVHIAGAERREPRGGRGPAGGGRRAPARHGGRADGPR